MRSTVAAQIAIKAVVQLTLMATTGTIGSGHLFVDFAVPGRTRED